jgi:MarR family transcriptional regulator, organic hydroperoxide resistance regulator
MKQLQSVPESMERIFIVLNEIYRKNHEYVSVKYKISSLEMELIQYVVLEGPKRMKDVSEHFRIKLSTLTSIIDKAEEHRVLKRVNSKEDRRVVYLDVTQKGKSVYNEYAKHQREMFERIESSLDETSFAGFIEGLETFNEISAK